MGLQVREFYSADGEMKPGKKVGHRLRFSFRFSFSFRFRFSYMAVDPWKVWHMAGA